MGKIEKAVVGLSTLSSALYLGKDWIGDLSKKVYTYIDSGKGIEYFFDSTSSVNSLSKSTDYLPTLYAQRIQEIFSSSISSLLPYFKTFVGFSIILLLPVVGYVIVKLVYK